MTAFQKKEYRFWLLAPVAKRQADEAKRKKRKKGGR